MQICNRGFRRWNQIPFAKCFTIKAFLNRIRLIQKFRELPNSLHTFSLNHKGGAYLGIPVLMHMQIEQILDQGPFQSRPPTCVEQEPAAGQFGSSFKINQPE